MKVKEFIRINSIDQYDFLDNATNTPLKRKVAPDNIPEVFKNCEIVDCYTIIEEDETLTCELYIKLQ